MMVDDGSKDTYGGLLDALAARESRVKFYPPKKTRPRRGPLNGYQQALSYIQMGFQVDSDDQFLLDDFWTLWEAGGPHLLL